MSLQLGGALAAPRLVPNQLVATLPSPRHPGHSEDAFFLDPLRGLGAVVDGMGGRDAGDLAAHLGRDAISRVAYRHNREGTGWPYFAITVAREAVLQGRVRYGNDMGATAVVAAVKRDHAAIAWCGDARAYGLYARAGLHLLTRDHGMVDNWRRLGIVTPEQAAELEYMLDNTPAESLVHAYGTEIAGLSDVLIQDPDRVNRWLKDRYIKPDKANQLHRMLAGPMNPEVARDLGGQIATVVYRNFARVTSQLGEPASEIGQTVVSTKGLLAVLLVSDGVPDNLRLTKMNDVVRETSGDLTALSGALVAKAYDVVVSHGGRAKADDMTALVLPVTLGQLGSGSMRQWTSGPYGNLVLERGRR